MPEDKYAIRGGEQGREWLRLLSRIMEPSTNALFDRLKPGAGASCLDIGCGGGDVTRMLAGRVIPGGHAVGIDFDRSPIGYR